MQQVLYLVCCVICDLHEHSASPFYTMDGVYLLVSREHQSKESTSGAIIVRQAASYRESHLVVRQPQRIYQSAFLYYRRRLP